MDQATLLKLYLSRDAHAEANRKIFGASTCENFTGGDHNREKMNLYELMVASQREQQLKQSAPTSESIVSEPPLRSSPSKAFDIERLVSELNDLPQQALSRKVTPVFELTAQLVDIEQRSMDYYSRNEHTYYPEFVASSSFSSSAAPSDLHSPIPTVGSADSYDYSPSTYELARDVSNSSLSRGSARHPVIAKRNAQIDKMITDAVQQRTLKQQSRASGSLYDNSNITNSKLATSSRSPESNTVPAAGHSKKMDQRYTTRFPAKAPTSNNPPDVISRVEQDAVRIQMTRNLHNQVPYFC